MGEQFELYLRRRVERQLKAISSAVAYDPRGPAAHKLCVLLDALEAVESGEEARLGGERLGYSPQHYDLRDCAEIKVPMVQERNRTGKSLGPSHRMIYREFFPMEGSLPVREILCCEPRANGTAFQVAGRELDRSVTIEVEELRELPTVTPAIGSRKDPDLPISPPRLPMPPDVAAAIRTLAKEPLRGHDPIRPLETEDLPRPVRHRSTARTTQRTERLP
jgi:hypothetical protein